MFYGGIGRKNVTSKTQSLRKACAKLAQTFHEPGTKYERDVQGQQFTLLSSVCIVDGFACIGASTFGSVVVHVLCTARACERATLCKTLAPTTGGRRGWSTPARRQGASFLFA